MPLATKLTVRLDARLARVVGLATAAAPLEYAVPIEWPNGSLPGQADRLFTASGTVQSGTPVRLALGGGTLTDPLGQPVALGRMAAVIVRNRSDANALLVGADAQAPVASMFAAGSHAVRVGPEGLFALASPSAGYLTTNTVSDVLTLTAEAGAVPYDIVIVGRTG